MLQVHTTKGGGICLLLNIYIELKGSGLVELLERLPFLVSNAVRYMGLIYSTIANVSGGNGARAVGWYDLCKDFLLVHRTPRTRNVSPETGHIKYGLGIDEI